MNWKILVVMCTFVLQVHSARILMVFPPPVPSHFILANRLATELSKKGHDVTLLNPLVPENVTAYKGIVLTGMAEVFEDIKQNLLNTQRNAIMKFIAFNYASTALTEGALKSSSTKKLLESNEKFDLVIIEALSSEAHLGYGHHFNATTVIFSSIGANTLVNNIFCNPSPPAYIIELATQYTEKMNFLQRFLNTFESVVISIVNEYIRFPKQNEILHKYFPDAPDVKELMHKASLILLNSHPSISLPVPLLPNMIEIGGFHISDPQPLPNDLKEYLDDAKEGFIFFSLGSHLKSSLFPKETWEVFLKVFSTLPYKILWKFDDELSVTSNNIRTGKWLPQNDILAHKNIKLFITHGGLLSTTEAVYHGVPIVGIPIMGDQLMNMQKAEKLGIGKLAVLQDLNEENLLEAIMEVLKNDRYRNNIQERSRIMKDQSLKPIDNAVYWIEYALRHKSAKHFKTAAIELEWYQLILLDVIVVSTTLIFSVTILLYWLFRKICITKCFRVKTSKKKRD